MAIGMERLIFGFALVLFFVPLLAGCGGGSVTIEPQVPGGLRPAHRVILDLAQAPDEASREKLLEDLAGKRGDNLDWQAFWRELRGTPNVTARLLPAHHKALFDLQFRSCEASAFGEYVSYLLANHQGAEYLLGPERACMTPFGGALAIETWKTFLPPPGAPPARVHELMTFLLREEASDPSPVWADFLARSGSRGLKLAVRELLEKSEAAPIAELVGRYAALNLSPPFLPELKSALLTTKKFQTEWFGKLDPLTAQRLTLFLLAQAESEPWAFTSDDVSGFTQRLLDHPFRKGESPENSWESYGEIRSILRALSRDWTAPEQVALEEKLEHAWQSWLLETPSPTRARFFADEIGRARDPATVLEIYWAALQTEGKQSNVIQAYKAREQAISETELNANEDRVLRARLAIDLAPTVGEEHKAVLDFCNLWERLAEPTQIISSDDLQARLEKGLTPGCFRANRGSGDDSALTLTNEHALTASAFSAVIAPDVALTLSAPDIELGIVDLSSERRPPPVPSLPTPQSFDAVVFPILVALVLPEDNRPVGKGTHFLVLHYTYHPAERGPADPREPLKGFPGGDLTMRTAHESPPFTFVSEGGQGQPAAPTRAGGLADKSQLDLDSLERWVLETEGLDHNPELLRPFTFEDHFTFRMAEALLDRANRASDGSVRVYGFSEYPKLLDWAQKKKLLLACRELMADAWTEPETDVEIAHCIETKIAPLALQQWQSALAEVRARGTQDSTEALNISDPGSTFVSPAAGVGPDNPEGARGDSGKVSYFPLTTGTPDTKENTLGN